MQKEAMTRAMVGTGETRAEERNSGSPGDQHLLLVEARLVEA